MMVRSQEGSVEIQVQANGGSRRAWIAGMAATLATAGVALSSGRANAAPASTESIDDLGLSNVQAFGATGDDSTIDSDALDAAIAAAGDGGVVYFPPGIYRTSRTAYPRPGQRWIGVPGRSILKSIGGVKAFIMIDTRQAKANVTIDGLVIDGNRESTVDPGFVYPTQSADLPGVGINVVASTANSMRNEIIRCEVKNTWNYGVVGQQFNAAGTFEFNVIESTIKNCGGGIAVLRSTRLRVQDCDVEDTRQQGIWGQQCRDAIITGNRALRNGVHGIVFTYSYDLEIVANNCSDNGIGPDRFGWGICLGGNAIKEKPNQYFSISGNRCDLNVSGGITMDPRWEDSDATHSQRGTVTGNVCTGDGTIGINGISMNFARDVTVSGNVVSGMPFHGINISYPDRIVVTGNLSTQNGRGISIESLPASQMFGHVIVSSNMCYENDVDFYIPEELEDLQPDIAVMEPRDYLRLTADRMGFFGASPVTQPTGYAVTTPAKAQRSFDPKTAGSRESADVLATLISDLRKLGLIG